MKLFQKLIYLLLLSALHTGNAYASSDRLQLQAYNLLIQNQPWLSQYENTIQLAAEQNSTVGQHFLFHQYHRGIRVYDADVKINLSNAGDVLSIFNHLKPINTLLPLPDNKAGNTWVYLNTGNQWVLAVLSIEKNARNERTEVLRSASGELIQERMLDRFARKDTLIQTKVFNPDPITTSGKTYGQDGKYKNNGGADAAELTAELKTVPLSIEWENDTFYTSSAYAIIVDMESPVQDVLKTTTNAFNFTRSNPFFREMNCMYHIQKSREYYTSVGLPFTGMEPVLVDPTAYQGMDQSRFSFFGSKRALFFGTGGVPDAEDADVIVHESTHGINNFIAPDTDNGSERLALEEANCDIMACLYSKDLSPLNWRQVFNWDGHNEYWDGRIADGNNKYPDDLSSDFYVSSIIWSSMLNDISEDLGRAVTTRLLFTSVYSYANYMTMQQGADLLMQADSLLYGNKHFDPLKYRLEQRGFMVATGVQQQTKANRFYELINTEGFANGKESLQISSTTIQEYTLSVLNLEGKELMNIKAENGSIVLSPQLFPSGLYLLKINNNDQEPFVSRIMRR